MKLVKRKSLEIDSKLYDMIAPFLATMTFAEFFRLAALLYVQQQQKEDHNG
jgi:hypothetical protein